MKQHAFARPRTKPNPSKVVVRRASQRAGAARVPYRLLFSFAHMPACAASGGRATEMSSSTKAR
eukprot:11181984-Alexandrium_andersonii.AAC.1